MGRRWDAVKLGPRRRRRAMMRKLQALDRLDEDGVPFFLPMFPSARRKPKRPMTERNRTLIIIGGVATIFAVAWQADAFGISTRAVQGTSLSPGDPTWPDRPDDAADKPIGQPPRVDAATGVFIFMSTQRGNTSPVTYDPCVPIHVVVNSRTAITGASKMLAEAIFEVEKATGLDFVIDGATDEVPFAKRPPRIESDGKGWAPVLVSWSDPGEVSKLSGTVAGIGGSGSATREGHAWFASGGVTLDGPQLQRMGSSSAGWNSARAVIMHEFGHLVGLNHVAAKGELMQPTGSPSLTEWGPGDRAGLAALGSGDCVDY